MPQILGKVHVLSRAHSEHTSQSEEPLEATGNAKAYPTKNSGPPSRSLLVVGQETLNRMTH